MNEKSNQLPTDNTLHDGQTPSLTSQCPVCKTDYTVAEENQCALCNWDFSPCPEAFVERYNSQLAWAKELWLNFQIHEQQLHESHSQLAEVKQEQARFEGKILYRLEQLEQTEDGSKISLQEQVLQGIHKTAEIGIQLSKLEERLKESNQERQILRDEVNQLSSQIAKVKTQQENEAVDTSEFKEQFFQVKSQIETKYEQIEFRAEIAQTLSEVVNNTNKENSQFSSLMKHLKEVEKEQHKFVCELSQLSLQLAKLEEEPKKNADDSPFLSESGLDYSRLRDFLQAGEWEKANLETNVIIATLASQLKSDTWSFSALKSVSCEDFKIIDRLWVRYSYGRFGFSVQYKIYKSLDENVDGLRVNLGWPLRVNYKNLSFDLLANRGHLPYLNHHIGSYDKVFDDFNPHYNEFFSVMASKISSCGFIDELTIDELTTENVSNKFKVHLKNKDILNELFIEDLGLTQITYNTLKQANISLLYDLFNDSLEELCLPNNMNFEEIEEIVNVLEYVLQTKFYRANQE